LGIEGELSYLHSTGSIADPASFGLDTLDSTRMGDWYGVVAGRLGYGVGPWLVYGKAGVAFTRVNSSVVDTCPTLGVCGPDKINATGSKHTTGAALGGGIEYALTNHWSIKGEYLWLGLSNSTYNVCGADAVGGTTYCSPHSVSNGISTGKVGVNYRF
jgi:outer membrane immunogenic protein